jgi:ADP-L-glycero-D-manno-heptose 6-epimerase
VTQAKSWLTHFHPTRIPQGRILVTGAAGFIGSALIWALNRAGHTDVIASDRLKSSPKFLNLIPLAFHDYVDADDLLERVRDRGLRHYGPITTVIHLGACSATTERDAQYLLRNNYEYTKHLAAATLAQDARFVYASSAATYGQAEDVLDDRAPLRALRPVNMYAYSKHLFDLHAELEGLFPRIVGVKYFNVFGPNEAHKGDMRSVVAKAYEQVLAQGNVKLFRSHRDDYKDGEQQRDFIYVKDAVDMTLFLASLPEAGGIYNIGAGKASTWNSLTRYVFEAMNRKPEIIYIDMPETLRPAYQYSTIASLARIREAGYTREVSSLREAIFDYLPFLQDARKLDPAREEID